MKMFTAIIGILALSVAGTAAFFSVWGISLLFAGAAFAAMIMAGVLEAGKLVMTSFLYRYWDRVPRMLKIYSTAAVITLVGITSLGIYGFLSDAYDDTRAKVEMHEHNIEQIHAENEHIEAEMASLKSSSDTVDEKSTETIAGFQKIYDNFVEDRRARQTSLSDRHKSDTETRQTRRQQLLDRLAILDKARSDLEASSGGLFSNKKKKLEELAKAQAPERASIAESMKNIDGEESKAVASYDEQITAIDAEIEAEYQVFVGKVNNLRDESNKIDNTPAIEANYAKLRANEERILENKDAIRDTDIGSFQFIAKSFDAPIDQVVKWFIIVIVIVFDPLAVALVLAYNIASGGKLTRDDDLESPKKKIG
jgi:hypothetical protein